MQLLRLIALPLAICKSYILSLKEGHSPEKFESIVNSLVSKGSTVTHQYSIFLGVAIEIPDSLLLNITELLKEVDIEEDALVSIQAPPVNTDLPEAMRTAGFGP
jgi:hypothetical protein